MHPLRPTLLLFCVLVACFSVSRAQVVLTWSEGRLTHSDLQGFLWGDDQHLVRLSSSFPEPLSPQSVQEDLLRMYHAEFARRTLGRGTSASMDGMATQEHFERYLLWRWLREEVAREVPGETELRGVYTDRIEEFTRPERFSFQRLFLYANDGDSARLDALHARMQSIRDEMVAGRSLEDMVEAQDLPQNQKDVLGPFRPGVINSILEGELDRLEPGGLSPVLVSDRGVHLLRLVGREESRVIPFEEVRHSLLRELLRPAVAARVDELLRNHPVAPGTNAGHDESIRIFLMLVSGLELLPEESETVRQVAIAHAREAGWYTDDESANVRSWLERRRLGDGAFTAFAEAEVQRRFEDQGAVEALLAEFGPSAQGRTLFAAEYAIVRERDTAPDDRRGRFEAHREAEDLAQELADTWRAGGVPALGGGALPETVHLDRTTGLVTIPQAGYQLSEAVRGLAVGEVGHPVFSAASRTFLVAKLTDQDLQRSEVSDDGLSERQRRMLRNHFLRMIKEEFRARAESDPAFQIIGPEGQGEESSSLDAG